MYLKHNSSSSPSSRRFLSFLLILIGIVIATLSMYWLSMYTPLYTSSTLYTMYTSTASSTPTITVHPGETRTVTARVLTPLDALGTVTPTIASTPSLPTCIVLAQLPYDGFLNMRGEPSPTGTILLQIPSLTVLPIVDRTVMDYNNGTWLRVLYLDKTGWVLSEYCQESK